MSAAAYPENWSTTPGIYPGIPIDDYHADRGAVSKSALDHLERSPLHFRHMRDNGWKSSEAKVTGDALHVAVLEPERFEAEYVERPTFSGKGMVARRKAWEEEHAGMVHLTELQAAQVRGMRESLLRLPALRWFLEAEDLEIETTLVFQHDQAAHDAILERLGADMFSKAPPEPTDLFVRTRYDLLRRQRGTRADIKTAADASAWRFAKYAADYRYDVQAAIYEDAGMLNGIPPTDFLFFVVEKEPPFCAVPMRMGEPSIEHGRVAYLRNLQTLAACQIANDWPGYSRRIVDLNLPDWAFSRAS